MHKVVQGWMTFGNMDRDGLGIKEKYSSWIVTRYSTVFIAVMNESIPLPIILSNWLLWVFEKTIDFWIYYCIWLQSLEFLLVIIILQCIHLQIMIFYPFSPKCIILISCSSLSPSLLLPSFLPPPPFPSQGFQTSVK